MFQYGSRTFACSDCWGSREDGSIWTNPNQIRQILIQSSPSSPYPSGPGTTDGWTVEKQYAFIEALAETGIVEEACRRVGMSRTSADNLRRRPCGAPFRRAWQTAIDYALYRVEENAHRRALEGVARPIFYKGEQVGEWRYYDERLTAFLLRCYRPERYGRARELQPPCLDEFGEEMGPEDPGITLDGSLSEIEWRARDVPLVELDDDPEAPTDDGSERS
jgi:hypothetical protein